MAGKSRTLTKFVNDSQYRGILFQILLAVVLVLFGKWLMDNTLQNLANQGKSLGFDFLTSTAGFQIIPTLGTWLFDYEVGVSTYLDVYFIGIVNTFVVALLGIVVATVLGFTIGIMRLSDNLVLRGFATTYIELLRNLPLLLQLFFWYFAVLRAMPDKRDRIELIDGVIGLNITGLYLLAPMADADFIYCVFALLVAVVITCVAALRDQAAGSYRASITAVLDRACDYHNAADNCLLRHRQPT